MNQWTEPGIRSRKLDPSPELAKIRFEPMQFITFRAIVAFGMLVDMERKESAL